MSEFIEFKVDAGHRFKQLQAAFNELKIDKDADAFRPDAEWPELFDSQAMGHFCWPTPEMRMRWVNESQRHCIIETPTESASGLRWDFFSMIDAFRNGDYELRSCELISSDKGRLEFYAFGYPYGGVGCMVALIESFGFKITGIDDGTGFQSFG